MITFVTFHIDCTPQAAAHIAQENVWLKNRQQYLTQIELLFRSVSVFHPNCRKVVVTDHHTDFSTLPTDINVERLELNPETVMLSRSMAQIDFVKRWGATADIAWLDSDMLVNGNLDNLFDGSFDIGVTYRTNHKMPINAGILFFAKARPQLVLEFLELTYQLYQTKYADKSTWWGDQLALIDAIGDHHLRPGGSDRLQLVGGATIALLPCAIYNFSPENRYWAIAMRLKEPRIIHFKGARKRLIQPYWQNYLAPLERCTNWRAQVQERSALMFESLFELVRLKLGPFKQRWFSRATTPVGSSLP